MRRHRNSVLMRKKCLPPSTVMFLSIKQDLFVPVRSGCSALLNIEGAQHTFFLFLENIFCRAAWNESV